MADQRVLQAQFISEFEAKLATTPDFPDRINLYFDRLPELLGLPPYVYEKTKSVDEQVNVSVKPLEVAGSLGSHDEDSKPRFMSEAELMVDLLLVDSVEETNEDGQKPDPEESSGEAITPIFMLVQNVSTEGKMILQGQPVVESQLDVVQKSIQIHGNKDVFSCQAQQVFDQMLNRDIVSPYTKFNRVQEGIAPLYLSHYGGDF